MDYLKADGAKAIGFDIIFSERSSRQEIDSRLIQELSLFAQNADIPDIRTELLQRLRSLAPGASDASFASAVKRAGNVFQSAVFYNYPSFNIDATVPFTELAIASQGIGHINFLPDNDGTYRRHYPFLHLNDREKAFPSLSLLIATYVKGIPVDSVTLPLLPDGSAFIVYQGGGIMQDEANREVFQSFYQYIPYDDVLASKDLIEQGREPPLPKGMFKDKIVLISASASGLTDLRSTPFSPVTPGVEIHANIIDNILSDRFLHTLNSPYGGLYIFFLATVIALISYFTGPYIGLFSVALTLSSVIGLHWRLFERGVLLPIIGPVSAMISTYLGILVLKYISENKEKKYVRRAFSHYIAPSVLEEILKSPDKLKLGGERKQMTVLFSDAEGFTALSEQLSPESIIALFEEYLSKMVECVIKTEGTLDKFIGDAVMAVWNAPGEQEDHAALACETAILMMKELTLLRTKWAEEKRPLLNVRIGINTGEMIVGNMGTREIFDYTAFGPEVNVASRLEALNKDFGTRIIVSENTRTGTERLHQERFVFRRLARVILKGGSSPLDVYELVGFRDEIDQTRLKLIEKFEKGLDLYVRSMFSDAKYYFLEALELAPADGPSKTYKSLCDSYDKDPPTDFGGIYFQKSK